MLIREVYGVVLRFFLGLRSGGSYVEVFFFSVRIVLFLLFILGKNCFFKEILLLKKSLESEVLG